MEGGKSGGDWRGRDWCWPSSPFVRHIVISSCIASFRGVLVVPLSLRGLVVMSSFRVLTVVALWWCVFVMACCWCIIMACPRFVVTLLLSWVVSSSARSFRCLMARSLGGVSEVCWDEYGMDSPNQTTYDDHVATGDVAPALVVASVHEQSCFLINGHLDLWAVVFSGGQPFSYEGGHLRSWAAICICKRLFPFMGGHWHLWAVGFVVARPWHGGLCGHCRLWRRCVVVMVVDGR